MAAGVDKTGENVPAVGFRQIVRETVLGYIFWSLFTGLVPMIWFYPLNELDITGLEGFAGLYFTPIFLGIGPLRRIIQTRWGLAVLRLVALSTLASFQMERTLERLIVLAVGTGIQMLVFGATFWSSSAYQRTITLWGHLLGYFAYLSSRIWFTSFVPTWWDDQTNSIVLAIGIIAVLDKVISGEDGLKSTAKTTGGARRPNCLLTGIAFGSLMYTTQALFGEVSLITRWVVKGYPSPGPMPNPWGAVVLGALMLGMMISGKRSFVTSIYWVTIGFASLGSLLFLPTWNGFTGGLVFAVYLMSIWPALVDRLTSCPVGRTLTLSMVTYVALTLFQVWTVAYNFVPGGEYTREHSDWLCGFIAVTLSLGLQSWKGWEQSRTAHVQVSGKVMPTTSTLLSLILIVLVGLGGFAARMQLPPQHPPKLHPKADFTAAIWTYHFGYDNVGWPSLLRSEELLRNTEADVITLLESDASKPFLGNNDLGMWLGEKLNMYVDFGPATRDHTWGNLLLSKYPFVKSTHHLLPSPKGELAPAVTATINMTGHLVDFVVTHMGNDRDILDRELQARFLARELRNAKNPAVFLGYVTSAPFSRDYKELIEQGQVKDIDDTDRSRWCEYIMYKGLQRLGYARVSHAGLSDTELQMARFRIPESPNYEDHDRMVIDKGAAEESTLFTDKFGRRVEGHNYLPIHNYHMGTPKYFTPKPKGRAPYDNE